MFGLKARDFNHLYYSSRRNPCPVCGRTHNSSCRVKSNGNILLVFCIQEFMHKRGDTIDTGSYIAHFAYPLAQNMGGAWYLTPKDGNISFKPKTVSEPIKQVNPLSIPEIDRNFRLLQQSFPLTTSDRKLLKTRRKLTDEQIQRGGYFSLPSGQNGIKAPKVISPHFPGLDANGCFNLYYSSIVCPIFNPSGQIIGAQRWQPQSTSKYQWLSDASSERPARIKPYGELPLTFLKPTQLRRKAIGLVEGTGFKPQIASDTLNQLVIGASGGQFISSPKFFREYLKTAEIQGCDRRIEIFPDAGDLTNDQVMYRWQRVVEFVNKLGHSVLIGYWGQHTKKVDPDIDELADLSQIRYLCPSDFFKLQVA